MLGPGEYQQLVAGSILIVGVGDDLLYRKYHNQVFLISTALALMVTLLAGGWPAASTGLLGALLIFLITLTPFLLGVIGGGDVKLLIALALCGSWLDISATFVWAVVWGAIFGVLQVLSAGQWRQFFSNLKMLIAHRRLDTIEPHRIPFTVAIFFGWLTHQNLQWRGVHYGF